MPIGEERSELDLAVSLRWQGLCCQKGAANEITWCCINRFDSPFLASYNTKRNSNDYYKAMGDGEK